MEFNGVGLPILPYEPPAEYLKPFFKRKFKTAFRTVSTCPGWITVEGLKQLAKGIASKYPVEQRDEIERCQLEEFWPWLWFIGGHTGRDSIGEEEFVELWMKRAFADSATRKTLMQENKGYIKYSFDPVDTNKDGFIDIDEFKEHYKLHNFNDTMSELLFNALDYDNDKLISLEEFGHMILSYNFCSGPDSIISLALGKIVD